LNAFHRALERFCIRHPKFGVRNLMLYIVIGSAVVYLFGLMSNWAILQYLYFDLDAVLHGQVWRLFTFVFIPADTGILWAAISLYFYYFIGNTLERNWGTAKFTVYYLFGMLLTMIYGVVMSLLGFSGAFLESSYINLSMFFAFAMLFPDTRVLLFFFIPIKIKWLAWLDAALFVIRMILLPFPANLLPLVAILNFFVFCWPEILDGVRRIFRRRTPETIQFRSAARKVKREQEAHSYRHKCAVCGRTDTEFPNLQFRYCSRCAGYHCFCEDHIEHHVHFTE
jgi:membrane associated rhomboid family serine protease